MNLTRQQWLALTLTVCVGAYAVGVLAYVRSIPDVGLVCAFDRSVSRVYPGSLRAGGDPAGVTGATVVRLAGRPVPTWPALVRAVSEVGSATPEAENPADLAEYAHVRVAGEDWVRVGLRGEAGTESDVWCAVSPAPLETLVPSLLWFLLEIGLFGVSVLVYWKRPADPSALLLFLLSAVMVGAYMGGYHWAKIVTQPVLLVAFAVSGVLLPPVALHFYLLFPRPKAWYDWCPRGALLLIYGPPLLLLGLILAGYGSVRWLNQQGGPPELVEKALGWLWHVIVAELLVALAWCVACVGCQFHAWRAAADERERSQMGWILTGSVLALVPIVYSLYLAACDPARFSAGWATWPMFAASASFTAAFAVSIARYRLLQLDQLVTSGMAWFLLSGLAVLVYYGLVFLGMLVLGTRIITGPSVTQALWVSSSALVLLLLLDVARRRVLTLLDRRYHRDKRQLDHTLEELGTAIQQLVDPPTLARRLLHVSADLWQVPRGSVYLREADGIRFRLAGAVGHPPSLADLSADDPLVEALQGVSTVTVYPVSGGPPPADPAARSRVRQLDGAVALALAQEDRLLGVLVLGHKPTGLYAADDLHLLTAFAQISTLALASAAGHRQIEALNRDLASKVEKIAEQQRRIGALQRQLVSQAREQPGGEGASADTPPAEGPPNGRFVGSSPAVEHLAEMARRVAARPSAVLIRGESGTGKELTAQLIHEASPRADRPFVKVHCAALAPGLLESELFGHVKGAFTGAASNRAGRCEQAEGGTLFLDEIGDISPDVQVKLLRVLQEKTFERVGSNEPVRADVRVITATHRNLEQLIREGRFREDLYYRLNVLSLTVPPLRERREDVAELALHFLREALPPAEAAVAQIDDDALAAMKGYAWPGNVRELKNVIERAVVSAGGPVLSAADLPAELLAAPRAGGTGPVPAEPGRRPVSARKLDRERREREELVRALAAARGNKAEAARALGVARSTLVSKLKRFGLADASGDE